MSLKIRTSDDKPDPFLIILKQLGFPIPKVVILWQKSGESSHICNWDNLTIKIIVAKPMISQSAMFKFMAKFLPNPFKEGMG